MSRKQTGAGGEEWRGMDDTVAEGYKADRWRGEIQRAQCAIPRIRQSNVELRLTDRNGKPLKAGQRVNIRQQRSCFLWGEQLWHLDRLIRSGIQEQEPALAWQRVFLAVFNACTALHYWTERPRNDGPKSEEQQGYLCYDALQQCVDWGNAGGLTVKGHPLFWATPKAVPEWLKRYNYSTQLHFLEVRIRSITARFRGKIKMYDAVNEPLWEPALSNLAKRHWPHLEKTGKLAGMIGKVLGWAREEDPDALFLVNDYGTLLGDHSVRAVAKNGTKVTADLQLKRYIELLKELHASSAAPDAVGLQSHTAGWGAHDRHVATYEAIGAETGLPVHITEFWARTNHLKEAGMPQDEIDARQAEYILNTMTCAFGCRWVDAFFFWGMMKDLVRFGPHGGWETTPVYDALRRRIKEEWMTQLSAVCDSRGTIKFRGFHGEYALHAEQGGSSIAGGTRFHVNSGKGIERITLPLGSIGA